MIKPVAEIRYSGDAELRPYRRGTYLGRDHLETMIERALGSRYRFGAGWQGYAVVTISLYDRLPDNERGETARSDQEEYEIHEPSPCEGPNGGVVLATAGSLAAARMAIRTLSQEGEAPPDSLMIREAATGCLCAGRR